MPEQDHIATLVGELPIADVVDEVRAALVSGNVLLHAEPGAGKSTGLPLTLLADASPERRILMLEPRRLAAQGVAQRLASQLGERVGERIGLRMRGQTSVSKQTIIEVVTEGVLTRLLQADPSLEKVGLVIFDEFHERSLHADLGLALTLEVQQALRSDLRLLLMSATLDAEQLGEHLSTAAQVYCAGRQHPVDIKWLGQSRDALPVRVAAAVLTALQKDTGDVLVFLPGVYEIDKTSTVLKARLKEEVAVYGLHGRADAKTQRAATAPADKSMRRVILSTSIAETSLTIDGVRVVIDAGLERRGRVDNATGSHRLETVSASQASATQRAGRAGRTSPGVCYRLWFETDHARRSKSWQAEIHRTELSALLMELGHWGASDPDDLPWLEVPPKAAMERAQTLLENLGIWAEHGLTEHGRLVASLPTHPRLGHMLRWAERHGSVDTACKLAVLIEDEGGQQRSANIELGLHSLSTAQKKRVAQLRALLSDNQRPEKQPGVGVLTAIAYPDWVAQRRPGDESRFALACGAGATMSSDDALSYADYMSVVRMGGAGREAKVFLAAALDINELEQWAPEQFTVKNFVDWDDDRERVVAEHQKTLGKLVVETKPKTDLDNVDKARALLSGIRKRGIGCLPWTDECREWQSRVALMQTVTGQIAGDDWPQVDDESLLDTLEQWLLVWLNGKSHLKSLSQLKLSEILKTMLDYQQQQALDAMLPTKYEVPSGSNIKLRYAGEAQPVLSVKLQEMFGCRVNPSIARGQINLKVELLSPARRPVQITTDLANFWTNSYPAVKKDLAGRYPKHDWPDDPLQATPTAFAKRRKR